MKDFIFNSKKFLFINFFLYLLLKVFIFFYSDQSVFFSNDSIVYLSLSNQIKQFGFINYIFSSDESTFFRTPLYPLFLFLLNNNLFFIILSQSIIMIVVCFIFINILKIFNLNNNLAATIILFTPNFFYHSSLILTETIFLLFFLLSILNLLKFIRTKFFFYYSISLICIVISSFARPISDIFIYFFLIILIYFYIFDKDIRISKKFIIVLFAILLISPNLLWKTRNFVQFNSFDLSYVNKNSVIHYYAGVIYNVNDIYQFERDYLELSNKNFNNSLEKTNYLYPFAIDYLLENKTKLIKNNSIGFLKFLFTPGEDLYFKLFSKLENQSKLFENTQRQNLSKIFEMYYNLSPSDFLKNYSLAIIFIIIYFLMYLFSFIGLLKFNKDKYKFIIPIIIIMLIFVPPSSFYYSNFRFRIPFEILSMIFYFNFFKYYFSYKN